MATAAALVVYALLLVPAAVAVWRRPVVALYAFLIGLAVYNLAMALLYGAGVHGAAIEAIQTWKEILLGVAVARVARDAWLARRLPFRPRLPDLLALAFAGLVVLYAVLPQGVLGGHADAKGVLYGLRHDLTPVAAYFVGRSVALSRRDLVLVGWTLVGTAGAVAVFGLIDLYAVPIEWWRDSGAVGFFRHQGYVYHGPGGLPENFVFNLGSDNVFRRLTSTFLGPLGTAYVLGIALLAAAAGGPLRRRPRLLAAIAVLCAAALLLTLSRSTILSLAGAFIVLALILRRAWPVAGAVIATAALIGLNSAFPHLAPRTHFFPADLKYQHEHAQQNGVTKDNGLLNTSEPSLRSHLHLLKEGLRTVAEHPQGFGLGNAGVTALRADIQVKAGESTYTELGVETGVLGMAAFVAWSLALLAGLASAARRAADETRRWACATVAAALALVLALAVQTDVLGVLWLAFCLWWVAGALLEPDSGSVSGSAGPQAATPSGGR